MESLIGLVNRIQQACIVLGDYGDDSALPTLWESLPFVVIVDGQSSRKSSVLESLWCCSYTKLKMPIGVC